MRQFLSNRLVWFALLVSVGIGALFARTLWIIRTDQWSFATQTDSNLARTIEQGLTWTLDAFDKSLQGAVHEVSDPGIWALEPELRDRLVFDNSVRARGAGDVMVLNAEGQVVLNSRPVVGTDSSIDFVDRDYFVAFKTGAHEGLFIGRPVQSRLYGHWILPMSRAYFQTDGRFAGVVVGNLKLSYLTDLLKSLNLGEQSGVNLFRADGIVIARFPYGDKDIGKDLAGTANFVRFDKQVSGSFVGVAAIDKVERLYSFRRVGDYPLIVNIARAVSAVDSQWHSSAWTLGACALLLMAACMVLALLFVRELTLRLKVSAQLRAAEQDMRTTFNNMHSLIGYWDAQLHNRFANQAYFEWFGMSPEKLRGLHISELLGPELYESNKPFLERALRGEPQFFERAIVDPRGVTRHTISSYRPDIKDGTVHGIFVQITDISDRKRMEEDLFDEKERGRLTLQAIGDAVVCSDAQGRVTYLNPVAERLTGWQAFDAAGHSVDEVVSLRSPVNDNLLVSPLRAAIQQVDKVEVLSGVVVHRRSGKRFQVEETISPITDRHGTVTGAVAVLRDVTEAVAMAQRMAHLAQYDALTDLPNRVLLQDRAQLAISQSRRSGKLLAVMYLDLDGFKAVNDRLGHEAGDQLLVQFAQRLKTAVRASDTVCRQGGDEFVVLLPGLDTAEAACNVARKILASCDAPFGLAGENFNVGLSGGIALYPRHGDTFDSLSRHADSAMYAAKRGGRMRFMLYQGPEAAPELVPSELPALLPSDL